MIEIGFSNNIYDNPRDVISCIESISREFRAIEIELAEEAQTAILDGTPDEYAEIVRGLRSLRVDRGLTYSVHAPWFGANTDFLSTSIEERNGAGDSLIKSLNFAQDIQAEVLTIHPGKRGKRTNPELMEILCQQVDGGARAAKAASIALCVENMGADRPNFPVFSSEEHIRICEQAGIAVCLDLPHLASVCPDLEAMKSEIRVLAPYVRHVHLGDTELPQHRHLPIGMGDLPLREVLTTLENCGYRGYAIVEEFNRGWAPEEYWSHALAFRDSVESRFQAGA